MPGRAHHRDGCLNAVIGNFADPPLLLHNESDTGGWIAFRLRGKAPNLDGLGATVTLTDDAGRKQVRAVQTGRSYLAAFSP